MNYKMEHRRNQIIRLAKNNKVQWRLNPGVHSRKQVEKTLDSAKKEYTDVRKKIEAAEAEAKRLDSFIAESQAKMKLAREEILNCHNILQNMDFSNAADIKINKDDIAYSIDGTWCRVSPEDHSAIPYSKWKKLQKSEESSNEDAHESSDIPEEFLELSSELGLSGDDEYDGGDEDDEEPQFGFEDDDNDLDEGFEFELDE